MQMQRPRHLRVAVVSLAVLCALAASVRSFSQGDNGTPEDDSLVETVIRGIEHRQALVETFEAYCAWWTCHAQQTQGADDGGDWGNAMTRCYCAFAPNRGRVDVSGMIKNGKAIEHPLATQWFYDGSETWRYVVGLEAEVYRYIPSERLIDHSEWFTAPGWVQLARAVPGGQGIMDQLGVLKKRHQVHDLAVVDDSATISVDCDGNERDLKCIVLGSGDATELRGRERLWIAPDLGFLIVKSVTRNERHPEDRHLENVTLVTRVSEAAPDIWFPVRAMFFQRHRLLSGPNTEWERSVVVGFEVQSLKVNQGLAEHTFEPTLPVGTPVYEEGEGTPTLWGIGDLMRTARNVLQNVVPLWAGEAAQANSPD